MQPTAPEFSRLIAIDGITPDKTRVETIAASDAECEALAKRLGLRELSDLQAKISIRRVAGGTSVRVEGDIEADVVQACVVSLQDVHSVVKSHFETFFTKEDADKAAGEVEIDPDSEDSPEMVHNGMIDLGEVVTQYLSLELDPYPRAPGVSLAAQMQGGGQAPKTNPFAVLEGLKGKGEKETK